MYEGERFNACSHGLGLMLCLGCTPILMNRAFLTGDWTKIAGALVFCLCAISLYAASTAFHSTRGILKRRCERLDHCAVFLLIAGSYTPFALIALRGATRWILIGVVWGAALAGIVRLLRSHDAKPALLSYLGLGWASVIAAMPVAQNLPATGLAALVFGAVLYSIGTIFYVNPAGCRHAHGVWHLFVVAGTTSHTAAIASLLA